MAATVRACPAGPGRRGRAYVHSMARTDRTSASDDEVAARIGDRVVWLAGADGRVPGHDRPWRGSDRLELHSPEGDVRPAGPIGADLAGSLNRAFKWERGRAGG